MKPERLPENYSDPRTARAVSKCLNRKLGFEDVLVQASISGYESGPETSIAILLRYSEISGIWLIRLWMTA